MVNLLYLESDCTLYQSGLPGSTGVPFGVFNWVWLGEARGFG